jgi:hypothetical protein
VGVVVGFAAVGVVTAGPLEAGGGGAAPEVAGGGDAGAVLWAWPIQAVEAKGDIHGFRKAFERGTKLYSHPAWMVKAADCAIAPVLSRRVRPTDVPMSGSGNIEKKKTDEILGRTSLDIGVPGERGTVLLTEIFESSSTGIGTGENANMAKKVSKIINKREKSSTPLEVTQDCRGKAKKVKRSETSRCEYYQPKSTELGIDH